MAAITVQTGHAGLSPTFAAANGGGDTVAVGQTAAGGWQLPVVLLVNNQDTTDTTVTVAGTGAVIVAAATDIGIIPIYNGASLAPVAVTYSKVTSLTVAAVRLTSPLA